jgi:hypothetical protein
MQTTAYFCDICKRAGPEPVGNAWSEYAEGFNLVRPPGYGQSLEHVCQNCALEGGRAGWRRLGEILAAPRTTP